MRGDVDAVHEIAPNAVDFVQAEGQTTVKTYPFVRPYYYQLVFNVQHPLLKNPAVRQALSYGVDRQAVVDLALNKQGSVAEGPDLAVPLGLQHGAEDLHAQFGGGDPPPRLRGLDGEAVQGKRPDAQPAAPPLHDAREGRDVREDRPSPPEAAVRDRRRPGHRDRAWRTRSSLA